MPALLEEAGLVEDQHGLVVAEGLDGVGVQVVADLVGLPVGAAQQMLDGVEALVANLLGELPGVLALDRREQAQEIGPNPSTGFTAGESPCDPLDDRFELLAPSRAELGGGVSQPVLPSGFSKGLVHDPIEYRTALRVPLKCERPSEGGEAVAEVSRLGPMVIRTGVHQERVAQVDVTRPARRLDDAEVRRQVSVTDDLGKILQPSRPLRWHVGRWEWFRARQASHPRHVRPDASDRVIHRERPTCPVQDADGRPVRAFRQECRSPSGLDVGKEAKHQDADPVTTSHGVLEAEAIPMPPFRRDVPRQIGPVTGVNRPPAPMSDVGMRVPAIWHGERIQVLFEAGREAEIERFSGELSFDGQVT